MSVMELLAGAGGAGGGPSGPLPAGPDPSLPPSIPDPENPADTSQEGGVEESGQGGSGQGEVDTLKQLISLGQDLMKIPTVEESERHEVMKALTIFQKLLAGNEKMADSLSGANPAMRKALGP